MKINKKLVETTLCLIIIALFFLVGCTALAGDSGLLKMVKNIGVTGPYDPGADTSTIGDIASRLIFWFLSLMTVIYLCFMIYAGYLWLTARGNSEQVEQSKNILRDAIIGMAIILSAAAITALIYMAYTAGDWQGTKTSGEIPDKYLWDEWDPDLKGAKDIWWKW